MADDHENPLAGGTEALEFREVADRVWARDLLPGQGNGLTIETEEGLIQVDTGFNADIAREIIGDVREVTDRRVRTIVYSHGHVFYNFGVEAWLADAERRGDPRPEIVAHENLPARYARYRETLDFQTLLTGWQSGFGRAAWEGQLTPFLDPDVVYRDELSIGSDSRPVELHWAPAETDDATAVWLPRERLLYGGAATIMSIPNVGTPLRSQRDPMRWARTLDHYITLEPETLVREFGPEVHGREAVVEVLRSTADALRWLRAETVKRLNQGYDVNEIIADIEYPTEWAEMAWMAPTYGHPDYIVRDIFRSETGWWDRNITQLHPSPPAASAAAIRSAISDPTHVLETARRLRADGERQLALHVIDLLALDTADDPAAVEARTIKAEIAEELASEASSFISANLYRTMAAYPHDRATG
jgi:alkyl sulfatase BDS1-like metallo-beta-lactamase superfamily hydrolase